MDPATFWNVMSALSESEPHTSYRTPLSLEWAVFNMFEEMLKSSSVVRDERSVETVQGFGTAITAIPAGKATKPKAAPKKRTTASAK
jgi:hypothetical protein